MHNKIVVALLTALLVIGCSSPEAPIDTNGNTPQQVMLAAMQAVAEGNFDAARKAYSDRYVEHMITSKGHSFAGFHRGQGSGIESQNWRTEWLKAELEGNKYNQDLWRVKVIIDAGKGKNNPPGVVHDLTLIDGVWKIVLWSDYPKT